MTSQSPIISYESLRTVMTHLDPLVRLNLSTHCPSFHNLTSIVPLKIQYLRITPTDFKINDTIYKIGIIKQYLHRRNPKVIKEENANGGRPYDTDQYGIGRNQRMSELLESLERLLERDQERIRESSFGQDLFEETEVKLDILRARRRNVDPPFSMYVQLLIIPDNGTRKVQYLVYNKTLQEVKDSWMLKLFGNNIPIHVKNMNVAAGGVLHLIDYGEFVDEDWGMVEPEYSLKSPYFPLETSKLKVSNLSIYWDIPETLNAIRPVLDGSPLKMIKVNSFDNIPDDPIIQTSKSLNITGFPQLDILMRFSNERIHLERCKFTEGDARNIIEHWQQIGIKIGTYISIGFRYIDDVNMLLNSFRELSGARSEEWKQLMFTRFPECVVLPIGDHSELNVYCETPKSQDAEYCDTQWIVRIKIQPRGYADNLLVD